MANQFINNAYDLACYIQRELEDKGTVTLEACHLASANTIVNIIDSKL